VHFTFVRARQLKNLQIYLNNNINGSKFKEELFLKKTNFNLLLNSFFQALTSTTVV